MVTRARENFRFTFADGDTGTLTFPLWFICNGRISASGLKVITFPFPWDDVEITFGERLGAKKSARVRQVVTEVNARGPA